jgi:hypothetical protein
MLRLAVGKMYANNLTTQEGYFVASRDHAGLFYQFANGNNDSFRFG